MNFNGAGKGGTGSSGRAALIPPPLPLLPAPSFSWNRYPSIFTVFTQTPRVMLMYVYSQYISLLFSFFFINSTLKRNFYVVLLPASFHVHLRKFVKIIWSLDGYISEENRLTQWLISLTTDRACFLRWMYWYCNFPRVRRRTRTEQLIG